MAGSSLVSEDSTSCRDSRSFPPPGSQIKDSVPRCDWARPASPNAPRRAAAPSDATIIGRSASWQLNGSSARVARRHRAKGLLGPRGPGRGSGRRRPGAATGPLSGVASVPGGSGTRVRLPQPVGPRPSPPGAPYSRGAGCELGEGVADGAGELRPGRQAGSPPLDPRGASRNP